MIPFLFGTTARTRDTIFQRGEEVIALFNAFCGGARTHAVIVQGRNETLRGHCSGAAYAAADLPMVGVSGLECLCARVRPSAAAQPWVDCRTGRARVRQRHC